MKKWKAWRTSDDVFIAENAGELSSEEIGRILGRSSGAIRTRAWRLRREGMDIGSLNVHESKLHFCGTCRKYSPSAESGKCRPCQLRERVLAHRKSSEELWAQLPQECKDKTLENSPYFDTSTVKVASIKLEPAPPKPRVEGIDKVEAERLIEEWVIAKERTEVANLEREYAALRQRETRWRRMIRKYCDGGGC